MENVPAGSRFAACTQALGDELVRQPGRAMHAVAIVSRWEQTETC